MMTPFKYAIFALIAILVNLAVQALFTELTPAMSYKLMYALLLGTAAGFFTKYELDRLFIFHKDFEGIKKESRQIGFYAATGFLTTIIFWAIEYGFVVVWQHRLSQYMGGLAGLSIGYVVKYHLDRKYVFL